ncbi:cyanophycinase [Mucisphaera sp.]|uniref:cyanophycinase n=1 Tax=Mucisphaera sp. TaxID=2913024 RepID=UPI003D0D8254
MKQSLLTALAILIGICLANPLKAQAPTNGHLLIIGGALDYEDPKIYHHFLDLARQNTKQRPVRIAVIPTASGNPERSGRLTAEDILKHAATHPSYEHLKIDDHLRVSILEITTANPEAAHDPDIVAQIDASDALWFTGGDQSRITAVFRPEAGDTPAFRAVRRLLERGGVVAGTSAGAAMMPERMIRWGNSEEALLIGRSDVIEDRGVGVGQGMGLMDDVMIDQHFLERQRMGRLIVGMHTEGIWLGLGINENRALAVDLHEGTGKAIGHHAVFVVDNRYRSNDPRERLMTDGYRMSLLSDGDEIELATGLIHTHRENAEFESTTLFGEAMGAPDNVVVIPVWDRFHRSTTDAVFYARVHISRDFFPEPDVRQAAKRLRAEIDEQLANLQLTESPPPIAWDPWNETLQDTPE